MSTRIFRLSALAVLVALLASACAAAASAGTGDPSLGAANNYLGAWFPSPTSGTSVDMYRADLTPFSNTETPEAVNFACVYQKSNNDPQPASPYGYPISSDVLSIVGTILDTARRVYADPSPDSDIKIPGDISGLTGVQWDQNGGMSDVGQQYGVPQYSDWSSKPSEAMYWFLTVAKDKLKKGGVTIDTSKASSDPSSEFNVSSLDKGSAAPSQTDLDQDAASLITIPDKNGGTPATLTADVPFSCNLNDFGNFPTLGSMLSIGKLIHDPATWFSNLFAFVPGTIALGIYNFVEPWAFRFAFWTPHTERGDTLLDVTSLSCSVDSSGQLSPDEKNWCSNSANGNAPLGFNTNNLDITKSSISDKTPGWIRMSLELQWLVSALYFIALFGCAILFMLRGHRSTTYHVVKMIPRIFAAVLLTVFSSYLIGGAISLSNHLVVGLFSSDASFTNIRALQEGLVNTGSAFGVDTPLNAWMEVILVGAADYFLVMILLLSIARQLVLVFLVCIAPVACFCIIHPSLERHWKRYLRVSLAVVITPAVMAIMLRLGVSINPTIGATQSSTSMVMGFFGAIITLITFWSIAYASKLSWAVIRDKQMNSSFLGRVGGALGSAGLAVSPYMPFMGAQLRGAGRAAGALGSLDNRGAYGMRNMLPDHKMRSLHGVNLGGQRAMRDMYKDMFRGMGGGKGSDDAAAAATMMPLAPFMGGGGGAAAMLEAGGGGGPSGRPRHRGTPSPSSPLGKVAAGGASVAARAVSETRDLSDRLARHGGERGLIKESQEAGQAASSALRRRAANRRPAVRAAASMAAPAVGLAVGAAAATAPAVSKALGAGGALAGLALDRSKTFHARKAEYDTVRNFKRGRRPVAPAVGAAHVAARKAEYRQHVSERKMHGFAPIPETEFNSAFDQQHLGTELQEVATTRRGKHKLQYFVDQPMPEPDFDVLATPAVTPEAVHAQMDAEFDRHEAEKAASGEDVAALIARHEAARAASRRPRTA